eukprot:TRINITY_DN2521_c0_g1_i4.p1 TRINITY_DN2521_c0_g1~~TRINITY_DN2521_c0_g1_i4.p1  ORF type:complete len:237 (-),score=39.89 TRINITY_DN2521_c0_g1_i4:81-791(-)
MKINVGSRLPAFTEDEKQLLDGSSDFFGLNHYTSLYTTNGTSPDAIGWNRDVQIIGLRERDGELIGPIADSDWLYIVPWGIQKLLVWIHERYNPSAIWITENGVDVKDESRLPVEAALKDTTRVDYYDDYLSFVKKAIDDDVKVVGYFAWSLLDNFEWADGYSKRFGLHYVDYKNNLTRIPKKSAQWFSDFIDSQKHDNDDWITGLIIIVVLLVAIAVGVAIGLWMYRSKKGYSEV